MGNEISSKNIEDKSPKRLISNQSKSPNRSPAKSPKKNKKGKNENDKHKRKINEKIVIQAKDKPKQSSEKRVLELVQKNNKAKIDYDMIYNIIGTHFFMQNLQNQAREEIITTMSLCKIKGNTTLFEQGTLGNYWYIVHEGSFEYYENNKFIRKYSKGESFGEINLMNNAICTGTMKSITDSQVWVLKREAFRKVIDFIFQINFEENMSFLNKITLPLDSSFKTLLANNLLQEYYKEGEYICKKGEVGNSMFIIKQGQVKCVDGDKVIRILKKGDNFGQKAILYEGVRTLDVIANTDCIVYSISVEFFKDQLGENYQNALYFSFIMFCFKKSNVFNKVTNKMLDQIFNFCEIINYNKNDIVYKKGDIVTNKLCIILEGNLCESTSGKIFAKRSEILFEEEIAQKQEKTVKDNLYANPDCLIAWIDYDKFSSVLGEVSAINGNSKKEKQFQTIKLFKNIGQEKLDLLQKNLQIEKFDQGKKIINQGEIGDKFYIIKSGRVDFFVNSKYVRSFGENEEFGARALLISEKRSATAIANGKVEVYTLKSSVFKSILEPNLIEYFKKRFTLEDTSIELKDLEAIQELGKGNFGFVYLVRSKKNKNIYAIKAMDLKQIKREELEPCVEVEKNVLLKIDHPFIMKMVKYMKNDQYIFFLNEYIRGKELWEVIRDIGLLSKEQTQFYVGSILLAIEYLHSKKIIYRDIKPENVMVNEDNFVKLIDFGTVKEIKERTSTIIGTPHYMAPEIVKGEGYSFEIDIWSIAVCMYEFFVGQLPFGNDLEEPMEVYKAVTKDELEFPSFIDDKAFINIMHKMLKKNPLSRLTNISKIKNDEYFKNFDWDKLINLEIVPPYKIKLKDNKKEQLNTPYLALIKSLNKSTYRNNNKKPSARQIQFEKWVKNF